MTPLATLLAASGLSQEEAVRFLRLANRDSLANMLRRKSRTPDGVLAEMRQLVQRQMDAAEQGADQIEAMAARPIRTRIMTEPSATSTSGGAPDTIELGQPSDDAEAAALGWPCVSAWQAMAGQLIALLPDDLAGRVVIVPRGSTPASAAAADAAGR